MGVNFLIVALRNLFVNMRMRAGLGLCDFKCGCYIIVCTSKYFAVSNCALTIRLIPILPKDTFCNMSLQVRLDDRVAVGHFLWFILVLFFQKSQMR